ncbi:MAG: hypothetical protein LPH21_18845 [Shewanella sp.]|nr:hypothetical protein [Shewanella sp.]MCF1431189.1 hypothetical protein [Shewanella sp.]MCF1459528.1 hypothetical protein [Shewanella sp.]
MLHIKDKSLFNLKILSFEYIKLKLENPGQQEITQSPKYRNEAYSYQVLSRVADIDDCFEQIKSPSSSANTQVADSGYLQLIDRCYLMVGTAIGLEDDKLQSGLSRDHIETALQQYPQTIISRLQKIESVATNCGHLNPAKDFIVQLVKPLNKRCKKSHSSCYCINELHRSVADLQLSLQDVFSMKLQRLH